MKHKIYVTYMHVKEVQFMCKSVTYMNEITIHVQDYSFY